jgi:thymidine kinase
MKDKGLYGIVGSMGGAKTMELIAEYHRLQRADWPVIAFTPSGAHRASVGSGLDGEISSRLGASIEATIIDRGNPEAMLDYILPEHKGVIIGEGHFFDPQLLIPLLGRLRLERRTVVESLLSDFGGNVFAVGAHLSCFADKTGRFFGVCGKIGCSGKGIYNQLWVNGEVSVYAGQEIRTGSDTEEVTHDGGGAVVKYNAMCVEHYILPPLAEGYTERGIVVPHSRRI